MLGEFDDLTKYNHILWSVNYKNSGPQFFLLSLFC